MTKNDSYKKCRQFAKWKKLINDQETARKNNQTRHEAPLCHDIGVIDYVNSNHHPYLTNYNEYVDHYDLRTYKYSNEVPVNKAFHAMGLTEYKNAPLDVNQEGRYLREFCVQRTSPPSNHFLHLRTLTDLRSKYEHQDPEKLMTIFTNLKLDTDKNGKVIEPEIDRSELPYDICHRWAEANRSMGIDRKFFIKMIRQDMKHLSDFERIEYLEIIIDHADDMDRHTMRWINNLNADKVEKAERAENYELIADYFEQKEQWVIEDEEDYEQMKYQIEIILSSTQDGLDRKDSTNPYSTNRLYNGNDALTWDFQQKIANADMKTIRQMQSNMFPQKRTQEEMNQVISYFEANYGTTPLPNSTNLDSKPLWKKGKPVYDEQGGLVMIAKVSTGLKYKPPVYSYFTKEMVSHFWTLIKLRKEELGQETLSQDKLSENMKVAINWIKQLGKCQLTCTIINSAIKGEATNAYGIKIQFADKLNRKEANTLWAQYKSM